MSNPDHNLVSFSGDAAGNIWRSGLILFEAFKPGELPYMREWREPAPETLAGRKWSDSIKFSGATWLRVIVEGELIGGAEDCVDFNHSHHCELIAPDGFYVGGQYLCTAKGDTHHIRLEGPVHNRAGTVHVDLGNISDQSREITTHVTIALTPLFGGPITYRRLNATEPTLEGRGPYKRTFRLRGFWRAPFAAVYAFLKRIGLPI